MTDKKFAAILAKNFIARELANAEPNRRYILNCLKDIENYLGTANQPDAESSFNDAL